MTIKKLIGIFIIGLLCYGFGPTGLIGFGAHTPPADGAAGLVFHDTFAHGTNGDALVGTTPDTVGTSWVELFNDLTSPRTLDLKGGPVFSSMDSSSINDGVAVHANYGSVGSADVDIEMVMSSIDTSLDDLAWLIARFIDGDNYIAVEITANTTPKMQLWKVVAGVTTSLGTSTNTPASTGATILLELRGTAWKVFLDSTEEISVTETDLSTQGKSGWGLGDIFDDFSGGDPTVTNEIDDFKVTEF